MVDMEGYRALEQAAGADSAARTGHESWIHRPWVPWAAGAVAFTLTILAGMVVLADAVWRNVEMQNFLERVEASEQAMQDLQDSTAAAFEDHGGEGQQQKLDAELRSLPLMQSKTSPQREPTCRICPSPYGTRTLNVPGRHTLTTTMPGRSTWRARRSPPRNSWPLSN